jgi:acetyltransferase-like isoleucine patch superfamily enzyme
MSIGLHQSCAFATYDENSIIEIGNNCGASGLKIHAKTKITIGNNVLIGMGSTILDNDAHNAVAVKREQNIIPSRPVTIGDNVFIGLNCIILKGVTIGNNSVIAAGSVVFSNIPENAIAAGNPCKVIIKRG